MVYGASQFLAFGLINSSHIVMAPRRISGFGFVAVVNCGMGLFCRAFCWVWFLICSGFAGLLWRFSVWVEITVRKRKNGERKRRRTEERRLKTSTKQGEKWERERRTKNLVGRIYSSIVLYRFVKIGAWCWWTTYDDPP